MRPDRETEVTRTKEDGVWRIGRDIDVAWIQQNTEGGLAITSGIPPMFEAYATLELPGSGDRDQASWLEDPDRHDAGVLTTLSQHTAVQPWWLGYRDTGAADVIFDDVPKVTLYAGWEYVLIEAGPEQAGRVGNVLDALKRLQRDCVARNDPLGLPDKQRPIGVDHHLIPNHGANPLVDRLVPKLSEATHQNVSNQGPHRRSVVREREGERPRAAGLRLARVSSNGPDPPTYGPLDSVVVAVLDLAQI